MIPRRTILAFLLMGLFACGDDTTTSSGPNARFTPDTPAPGNSTMALLQSTASGAAVNVRITATGIDDFFGAAFRITYDPDALLFGGWDDNGSFLLDGVTAADVLFQVDQTSIGGQVVIVATRLDPVTVPAVDVGATATLLTLNFVARRPIAAGAADGRLDFGDPKQVCDGTVVPSGCNGITVTWSGGGLSTN